MHTVVIGGGPAGMMAAISAAEAGSKVTLLEKNEKLGKKLFITGKGRCNLTNTADTDRLFFNIVNNPKFLYSAIYGFDNNAVWSFFEDNGLRLKEERGGRVFPESDKSSDVIKTLEKALRNAGVEVFFNTKVTKIETRPVKGKNLTSSDVPKAVAVVTSEGKRIEADAVIVATGGVSYASTGSTGDGYTFAKTFGHTVKEPVPALVPFIIKEDFCKKLSGLSLRNVEITVKLDESASENVKVKSKRKRDGVLYSERGEMLFTHEGVSGPLILSASSHVNRLIKSDDIVISIDLKPALSLEQLNDRIRRDLNKNNRKEFKNSLNELLPSSLIPVIVELSGIQPDKQCAQVNGEESRRLAALLKDIKLHVERTAGFNEAIITSGGINVKEIDASTMESKLVKGLYFAGEVIDVDALTGGYNLQIAWSTGRLAGLSCAENENKL